MKKLYLTRQQALGLGEDLIEYARMKDTNDRLLFKGFMIEFGDLLARELRPKETFTTTPISEYLLSDEDQPE